MVTNNLALADYDLLRWIPLIPLLAAVFNLFWGRALGRKTAGALACAAVGASFVLAFYVFWQLPSSGVFRDLVYTWIDSGSFKVNLSFQVDALSAVMLLIVTGIGFLIHIYSLGYMGAFATGFLLYGIALIYGATGSTNLNLIADFLIEQPSDWPLYLIGGGFLLLVGFAFKVGAVPFHFWVPDVYEGAPTPVTGFMAVAVKAAAFAAWARILLHKFSPLDTDWVFPLWVIAIATMTFGNLLAITQTSVKRMLDRKHRGWKSKTACRSPNKDAEGACQ